jgi:hypothetical protein
MHYSNDLVRSRRKLGQYVTKVHGIFFAEFFAMLRLILLQLVVFMREYIRNKLDSGAAV